MEIEQINEYITIQIVDNTDNVEIVIPEGTFITDFTYSSTDNTLQITQNNGFLPKTATILGFSGLTINQNLTTNTLEIGSKITKYDGFSDLNGLFLSGTSDNGFVLAPLSAITSTSSTSLSGGVTNSIAKWSSSSAITNSIITDDGNAVLVNGTLSATTITGGDIDFITIASLRSLLNY